MKTTGSTHEKFRVGDLELDSGTFTLRREGEEIALPKLSFELLLCLARHAPNVVTTDTLMDEVWGKVVVGEETVKQRVKLLRKSLGDSSSNPVYISAVRGRGYRLLAEVSPLAEEAEVPVTAAVERRSIKTWLAPIFLLAVIAIVLFAVMRNNEPAPASDASTVAIWDSKRVAVLPLNNFSGVEEDEYLADGVTEDIISALARVPDLNVISRTTMMHYRDTRLRIRDIAAELEAGTALEGSIQRFDEQLRITVQMIDANTDVHYWAQTYDVSLADLPQMQADLAGQVAKALETSISKTTLESLTRGSTDNPEAYEAYLKGRSAYRRWTRHDNETALAFYQRAAELDPGFALAVAGAANAHALRTAEFGLGEEWIDEAILQARQALELEPELPEALKALGICYFYKGHYQTALDYYRSTLRLAPTYDEAIFNIAELLQILGRWDQAVKYQLLDTYRPRGLERLSIYLRDLGLKDRAAALVQQFEKDLPVSYFTDANLSLHHLLDGEFEQARMAARRMQRAIPGAAGGWLREGEIDLFAGDPVSAKKHFQAVIQAAGGFHDYARLRLAQLQLLEGDSESAESLLKQVEASALGAISDGHEGWFHRWNLAYVHSLAGNRDAALGWFEQAVDSGRRRYEWDELDPAFQPLTGEPRFAAALQQQRELRLEMKDNAANNGDGAR